MFNSLVDQKLEMYFFFLCLIFPLGYNIYNKMFAFSFEVKGVRGMANLYNRILLPVDSSQQSIDAFKTGVHQAKNWNSHVYVVQVLPEDYDVAHVGERESFLNALESYARREGVPLTTDLVYGDPRAEIARGLVDRWDIDLIIMGATGKGRLTKLLIGSVTHYVVQYAKCDLIVSR